MIKSKYRVRVLFAYPIFDELNVEFDSWDQAIKLFQFYVSVCLAFPKDTSVRCVNIFKVGRQKSIRLFQNY